ncbi:cell wall hydrolase [Fervidibacillus halotolerans]|uniref:Cell wall hydrolase n=2 Tax=Fervidibacillus halotolerans TaxID=2980027 RepID=A0A9E8S058_9BACI|nr:cell wall hydrolase [Fervidibacillus halotolerans]WAA13874.1 cell wall hydrolase [Fervidibacillus halotolerans]
MMFFGTGLAVDAATIYTVKSGDSLYKIGKTYGVSVQAIQSANQIYTSLIYPGQQLTIPTAITTSDKDLLARLVYAEAKGEPYAGKVAVALVVLNRVDHPQFPNTIQDVIYSMDGGYYAFTPVANGQINIPADSEAKRAVEEALAFRGQGSGSLYFYNPAKTTSKWILSRPVTITIGNHVFAK